MASNLHLKCLLCNGSILFDGVTAKRYRDHLVSEHSITTKYVEIVLNSTLKKIKLDERRQGGGVFKVAKKQRIADLEKDKVRKCHCVWKCAKCVGAEDHHMTWEELIDHVVKHHNSRLVSLFAQKTDGVSILVRDNKMCKKCGFKTTSGDTNPLLDAKREISTQRQSSEGEEESDGVICDQPLNSRGIDEAFPNVSQDSPNFKEVMEEGIESSNGIICDQPLNFGGSQGFPNDQGIDDCDVTCELTPTMSCPELQESQNNIEILEEIHSNLQSTESGEESSIYNLTLNNQGSQGFSNGLEIDEPDASVGHHGSQNFCEISEDITNGHKDEESLVDIIYDSQEITEILNGGSNVNCEASSNIVNIFQPDSDKMLVDQDLVAVFDSGQRSTFEEVKIPVIQQETFKEVIEVKYDQQVNQIRNQGKPKELHHTIINHPKKEMVVLQVKKGKKFPKKEQKCLKMFKTEKKCLKVIKKEKKCPNAIKKEKGFPVVVKREQKCPKVIKGEQKCPKVIKRKQKCLKVIKKEHKRPEMIKKEGKYSNVIYNQQRCPKVIKIEQEWPKIVKKEQTCSKMSVIQEFKRSKSFKREFLECQSLDIGAAHRSKKVKLEDQRVTEVSKIEKIEPENRVKTEFW